MNSNCNCVINKKKILDLDLFIKKFCVKPKRSWSRSCISKEWSWLVQQHRVCPELKCWIKFHARMNWELMTSCVSPFCWFDLYALLEWMKRRFLCSPLWKKRETNDFITSEATAKMFIWRKSFVISRWVMQISMEQPLLSVQVLKLLIKFN